MSRKMLFVVAIVCDQFNTLYSEKGQYICATDGGITVNGDGKCADFFEIRKNCERIL